MADVRKIQPESVSTPGSSYSQGVLVEGGRMLFMAGQVPVNGAGELVGEGDFTAQARQVFENIKAIVEEAGGNMGNIVKITAFLTDIGNFPEFSKVRSEYLVEPFPAASLVGVSDLVLPEWLVEVEGIGRMARSRPPSASSTLISPASSASEEAWTTGRPRPFLMSRAPPRPSRAEPATNTATLCWLKTLNTPPSSRLPSRKVRSPAWD